MHDGGLGQDVVPVEAEPAHGSLDTEERGSAQGGCANLSCPAKESATNIFRTVTRTTCVSEQGSAKQLTGKDPWVRRRNMTNFYVLPWTSST